MASMIQGPNADMDRHIALYTETFVEIDEFLLNLNTNLTKTKVSKTKRSIH